MSLKRKAIAGFSWTVFEGVFSQGAIFIVGIILARLLTPKDFGVVGIITAIIAVCNSVVEAGFGSALIRKLDANNTDFNTAFYTNLVVAVLLYFVLFLLAPNIAMFFDTPILSILIQVSGLVLVINAMVIIQRSLLSKALNFKKQGIIAIISSILSGIIAVGMATLNFGVWSLVALSLFRPFFNTILLWLSSSWFPKLLFSWKSFKDLFDYGSKLLLTNLINTAYKNIYYFLIGKYFNPIALGYYTRADQFQAPFSTNITFAIRRVSFPILSNFQNDSRNLKLKFVQFIRFSMLLNFSIMLGIAATAEPLVLLLIGDKWTTSIEYLQLLCIPGILYPLQILHLNLLLIKGYSNLNLRLELIKKIILIPIILISINFGISEMIYGLMIFSIIEYFINSYYTRKIIDYPILEQFKDFFPFIIISGTTFTVMFSFTLLDINLMLMLVAQIISGVLTFIIINEILALKEYKMVKTRLITLFRKYI